MTHRLYEVSEFECDDCGTIDKQSISPDYSSHDQDASHIWDLKRKGWVYDEGNDKHYCPDCAKKEQE